MKGFLNILCAVTPAPEHAAALQRAVSLAENNQASLTVAAVIPRFTADYRMPEGGPVSAEMQDRLKAEHLEALESFTAPYRGRVQIRHEVLAGRVFMELIRAVLRNGHDLVIKPAENPGYVERLFGSDDMHLLRKCPCPLWLTKPGEKADYERILAAVDLGTESDEASRPAFGELDAAILELASSLAVSDFTELHVVHAWDAPAESILRRWNYEPDHLVTRYVDAERERHQRALERARRALRERLGEETYDYVSPRFHLQRGPASRAVPDAAGNLRADLVVMGTLGRSGIAGLFIGNTAEAILEQLQCSVLALKPPGFVTPVTVEDAAD